ncbi:Polypeptide release factor (eRF1) in translation termination, partial [Tulasnella sp. 427]
NGFNQAIDLAAESLANVKFVQEKRLIEQYFNEINLDSGKYCFGIDDTLKALEMGAVETLIVWENLPHMRYTLRNAAGEEVIIYGNKENEKDKEKFLDKSTGQEMEPSAEPQSLLEWFAERYRDFGAKLEFVTNRSQEGSQFVKGFGGIGGILRYKVDMTNLAGPEDDDDEFYDTDDEPMGGMKGDERPDVLVFGGEKRTEDVVSDVKEEGIWVAQETTGSAVLACQMPADMVVISGSCLISA